VNGLDIMTVSVPAFPCTVGDPDVVLPPVAGAENIDVSWLRLVSEVNGLDISLGLDLYAPALFIIPKSYSHFLLILGSLTMV